MWAFFFGCFFHVNPTTINTVYLLSVLSHVYKSQRGRLNPEHFVIIGDDVATSSSHTVVNSLSKDGVTFPFTSMFIPQPHRGNLFLMVVERLPLARWSDVPAGHNTWWMSRHISRRWPGMQHTKNTFPGGLCRTHGLQSLCHSYLSIVTFLSKCVNVYHVVWLVHRNCNICQRAKVHTHCILSWH